MFVEIVSNSRRKLNSFLEMLFELNRKRVAIYFIKILITFDIQYAELFFTARINGILIEFVLVFGGNTAKDKQEE